MLQVEFSITLDLLKKKTFQLNFVRLSAPMIKVTSGEGLCDCSYQIFVLTTALTLIILSAKNMMTKLLLVLLLLLWQINSQEDTEIDFKNRMKIKNRLEHTENKTTTNMMREKTIM